MTVIRNYSNDVFGLKKWGRGERLKIPLLRETTKILSVTNYPVFLNKTHH
jgi:hypothetical protein